MRGDALESVHRRGVFMALLVVVALGLRAGVVGWLSDTVPYTDFAMYHVAGAEIARDPGFLFDAAAARRLPQIHWWPPGYPAFLGSVYALLGLNHRAAVWVQVLLGVLTCVFVYGLARRLLGERVARSAAMLVALNPTYIFLTNQLASENLYMFWLTLGLWMVGESAHRARSVDEVDAAPSPRAAAALACGAGIVLGLGALTRAVGLVVPAVAALWMWRGARASHRARVAWMLAGVVLAITPWSVRNALVVGQPAVVSFGGGLNFYFGHNEEHIGYQDVATSPLASIRDPAELDRTGYKLGLQFIGAHPGRDLRNAAGKLGALYAFPDYALHVNSGILIPDVRAHPERAAEAQARLQRQRARDRWLHGPLTVIARVYYICLGVAAFLTVVRSRAASPGLRLAVWLVLAWTLVHVVYWAQPRFRAPVEVPLALLAAPSLAFRSRDA